MSLGSKFGAYSELIILIDSRLAYPHQVIVKRNHSCKC